MLFLRVLYVCPLLSILPFNFRPDFADGAPIHVRVSFAGGFSVTISVFFPVMCPLNSALTL